MNQNENKMGVMPVKKLIITMSLPMMISMLVQALYNIVDSYFVAQISESAITAVTLAFPLQNLMIAVGSGTGVGINALLSRSLGEKRFDKANTAANTGLFLTFFNFLVFLIVGVFFAKPFIVSQAETAEIATYGTAYLQIVNGMSIGLFFQMTFERLLQSTGRTFESMISQVTGAVLNIIFDPILIFGIGIFPELGVAGAAYATILGQCVAAVVGLVLNLTTNHEIQITLPQIVKPDGHTIREIYEVGVPSILMMSIGSLMSYLMIQILNSFSSTATAVFGVYFRLQSFFFMPVFGLNNGLIPVLAYNYGAKNKKRIEEALRFAMTLAITIMVIGTIVFEVMPEQLLQLFKAQEEMLRIGVPAMRIIGIHFPLAGASIAMGSIFQAFAKSVYSLIVSVGRQLVVLIPAAWLLAQTGEVINVWWAFPIAEVVSLTLSFIFFRKLYRAVVKNLEN